MPWPDTNDNEFRLIEPLINYSPPRGRKPTKVREMFNGILWILCSGSPWRDLLDRYPPWKSVYHRFRYYQKHGILEQVVEMLLQKASKNRKIQMTLVCIDGTYIRAHQHAAGARKKTSRSRSRKPKPNRPSAAHAEDSPPSST